LDEEKKRKIIARESEENKTCPICHYFFFFSFTKSFLLREIAQGRKEGRTKKTRQKGCALLSSINHYRSHKEKRRAAIEIFHARGKEFAP